MIEDAPQTLHLVDNRIFFPLQDFKQHSLYGKNLGNKWPFSVFTLDIVRVQNLVRPESLVIDPQLRRIYQISSPLYPTKHRQLTNMLLWTTIKDQKSHL